MLKLIDVMFLIVYLKLLSFNNLYAVKILLNISIAFGKSDLSGWYLCASFRKDFFISISLDSSLIPTEIIYISNNPLLDL